MVTVLSVRLEQRFRVRVVPVLELRLPPGDLDDAFGVHHVDAIGDVPDDGDVVVLESESEIELRLKVLQQ